MAKTSFKNRNTSPETTTPPEAPQPVEMVTPTQSMKTPKFIEDDDQAPQAPVQEKPKQLAPAVVAQKPLAVVPATETNEIEGEVTTRDFVMPYLSLAQKVGDLGDKFEKGAWVLNSESQITGSVDNGFSSVFLSVLKIRKFYEEQLLYPERGRRFDTLEEVKNAGLHLEWIDGKKPPCSSVAEAFVIIEKPDDVEGLDEVFPFEFNGKFFAPAIWTMRSTAYRAAQKVFTAGQFALKGKLKSGRWELSSQSEKGDKGLYYIPVFERAGSYDADFVEFFKTILG